MCIEPHTDDHRAAGEVVKTLVLLVVTPNPAVDLAVGFVTDLAEQRLAVDQYCVDMVAAPLVVDLLTAGAEASGALPGGVVAVADGQRGGAGALAFLRDTTVAV
ncbi:MAG: hypothetical protein ACXV8Q_05645 [Methylobacter sp.]